MKMLIIYASKTGTTEKCANLLKEKLEDADISNIKFLNNDINNYDLIVIGTPIRMGLIDKNIKKFLINNIDILKSKKTAYFVCCSFKENYLKYFEQNFPQELLNRALIYDTFGGELDLEKQKGFDKFIVKMVSKNNPQKEGIKILTKKIDNFVNKLRYIIF